MSLTTVIVEACPDAVVVCDAAGVISVWNGAAESLFGWTAEEAVGSTPADLFVPPELQEQYALVLQQTVKSGRLSAGRRKITVWNREQRRIAVDFRYQPANVDGQILIVGYFRDTTRVDHLEATLARRELESRILRSVSLYSTEEESFDSVMRQALDTLCELTGWPLGHALLPSENDKVLKSTSVWSSAGDTFHEFCQSRVGRRFARGESMVGRVWASGQLAWGLLTDTDDDTEFSGLADSVRSQLCVPVKVRKRVIAVLEFFLQDGEAPELSLQNLVKKLSRSLGSIIERRDWEQERRRMAAIVESSYDAILSKDPDGVITSWNEGAERLYGYSAAEAIGQSTTIILPEGREEEEPEIQEALKSGERLEQFETKRRHKNGDEISVSLTMSPLRDSRGKIIGSASIERDMTRRKERQIQLQQAIVAAEQASLAKSEFMANISHELRTPMNAIIGMTGLALQENLPDVVRDYLTTAKDSADTMLFLINDILDFSRLEADQFELDPAPFDVRRMLDETLRTLSLRAHEKGLELIAKVSPDVPKTVVGDEMRLRQVLTNLIGNAIKFTEAGEVLATVDVANSGEASRNTEWSVDDLVHLRFSVQDTGIGISEDDQKRIFAPFTQADASTTRTYAGTGLGLSICCKLVRLMNGEMSVESKAGKGSTFSFEAEVTVAAADDGLPDSAFPLEELKNTPVLVVDDNGTTRGVLKKMLKAWSMQPVTADSADAAFRELESASVDGHGFPLLIVDAVMPQQDGLELLKQIEESTETAGATILMMSPADQALFRERADEIAVNAILEKPISQSGLLNAISEAFGNVAFVRQPDTVFDTVETPLNVLVAEDIAANQKVIKAILSKRGHNTTIAHNGREAIDLLQREKFDAVLMDVQMPIMDGLQAVRAIRSGETAEQHMPIIAMTAHAMRGDREACLQAGMDAYIAKPIEASLLLKTLERLAGAGQSAPDIDRITRKSGTWRFRRSESSADGSKTVERTPQQAAPVWRPEIALGRMGGDKSLLASMIDFFFEDSPQLRTELEANLKAKNAEEATRVAHSLKGLCSNFEATEAVARALSIEVAARESRFDEAAAELAALDQQLERLAGELSLWKAELQFGRPGSESDA